MQSPFLGMDPYIEACGLWPDCHSHLIERIYDSLAAALPDRYVVRTGERSRLRMWEEHKKTVVFITHSVDEAVFLGDRIMVMTAQPGKVKTFVQVPLARPRNIIALQQTPKYGELITQIWSSLREEVDRARLREEEITP